jgi:hypothetical protein
MTKLQRWKTSESSPGVRNGGQERMSVFIKESQERDISGDKILLYLDCVGPMLQ